MFLILIERIQLVFQGNDAELVQLFCLIQLFGTTIWSSYSQSFCVSPLGNLRMQLLLQPEEVISTLWFLLMLNLSMHGNCGLFCDLPSYGASPSSPGITKHEGVTIQDACTAPSLCTTGCTYDRKILKEINILFPSVAKKYSGVKGTIFILIGLEDRHVRNIKGKLRLIWIKPVHMATDSKSAYTNLQFRESWRRVRMKLARLCTSTFLCALSGPTQGTLHWMCELQTLLGKCHYLKTFRLRCLRKPSTVDESFSTHIQAYKNVIWDAQHSSVFRSIEYKLVLKLPHGCKLCVAGERKERNS